MKQINYIVQESISVSLKDKLLALINNPSLDNETAMKMLNVGKWNDRTLGYKADHYEEEEVADNNRNGKQYIDCVYRNKKTGETRTSDHELDLSPKNWELISKTPRTKIVKNGIFNNDNVVYNRLHQLNVDSNVQKDIYSRIIDMNMMDRYFDYLGKPTVSTANIIKGSNIFTVFNKTGINRRSLFNISQYEAKDLNGTSLGKYEILLKLLLSDYDGKMETTSGNRGDVVAGNLAFEIKVDGGRAINQASPDPSKIKKSLETYCKEIPENPFGGVTSAISTMTKFIDAGLSDEDICKAVSEAMNIYYGTSAMMSQNVFYNFIYSHIKDIRKDTSLLYRVVGIYQILEYQRSERWNYLLLIDKASGLYTILDASKFDKDAVSSYDVLYDNKHLGFGKGIITNDTRSKAVGLVYKK